MSVGTRVAMLALTIGLICVSALAGFIASKYEVFERDPREFISRVVLKFDGPEPLLSPYRSRLSLDGCQCAASWRICPCGSTTTLPPYEQEIWKQVLALPMPDAPPLAANFRTRLSDAVGYDSILPDASNLRIETFATRPFGDATLESLHLHYERPKTRVVAQFAKRTERSEKLLILLHDTGSNGERMLMETGRPSLREGFDVVAFDVTSNTTLLGIVNAAWQLLGVHAAGLWPRAVCDFAEKHQLRQQYKRIVVYGEGDGARYAGYLANLCEAFDTIILEGGDSDPSADYPSPLKRVHRLFLGYWHDHLTAFPARTSIRDILANSRSRLILIGDAEDYRHRLRELVELAYDWRPSLAAGATGTRLVFRPEAVRQRERLLGAVLAEDWDALEGASLHRRLP